MMNRVYSLNRSMSVRTTDHFPYLLIFSKSCNIFLKKVMKIYHFEEDMGT